jgi:hypothetical protein
LQKILTAARQKNLRFEASRNNRQSIRSMLRFKTVTCILPNQFYQLL